MINVLNIINMIGSTYHVSKKIYDIIGLILSIIVIHKAFYFFIGMFFTRKFKPAKKCHKYGILIAARNEKYVIGNLIDSINKQKYPKDKLTIFVVADNCTDNTAEIARNKGAICYERNDLEHRTKGYALEFLLDKIEEDYGRMNFEGFFVFDADNLLRNNYISKMNDAFDAGEKIITSYRNTKNFDENYISSMYALHWIRSIRTAHRARSVLHLATNIQGTGFLFSSEIVRDGWHYTSLTEDRAMTADAVAHGYMITYQDEAEFFDEQPISMKVALRQRIRWSKGHLLAFVEIGPSLLLNIFFGKRFIKKQWSSEEKRNSFFDEVRCRFAAFDTLVQLLPISVINIFRWLIVCVIIYGFYEYGYGIHDVSLFAGGTWLSKVLRKYFDIRVNLDPGVNAMILGMLLTIWLRILYRLGSYLSNTFLAIYLFIIDESRIKKMNIFKKIWFCFTWPLFDIIGRYSTYIALFMKVTWKPIPHESKVTIDDIEVK